ncbi:6-carboxytetrahydropterin synthase [Geotalea daltonii]|uniref:6-carboxytetrahydropterin synthase n=1 Tax=Geotalea daltonii TaxID=1203471 RepID=UPI000191E11A|nr:6-carboxytetrahydropterin synthase [Geotalea daltonii]
MTWFSTSFAAAHCLMHYHEDCENLHGHLSDTGEELITEIYDIKTESRVAFMAAFFLL